MNNALPNSITDARETGDSLIFSISRDTLSTNETHERRTLTIGV